MGTMAIRRSKLRKMNKYPHLVGKRFGRLVVFRKTNKRIYGSCLWFCKCDCGNTKLARSSFLLQGKVKSCGCLIREAAKKNVVFSHFSTMKPFGFRQWRWCRRMCAIKRNLSFTISLLEFNLLTLSPCFYCGAEANPRNGLDRVKNNIGYEFRNCVPCCHKCNWMKKDFSVEVFLSHVEKIYKKSVLRRLEDAGAFKNGNTNFEIEE